MKQRFCPGCGSALNKADIAKAFCPRCGLAFESTDTDPRKKFHGAEGEKRIAHKRPRERRPI